MGDLNSGTNSIEFNLCWLNGKIAENIYKILDTFEILFLKTKNSEKMKTNYLFTVF